MSQPIMDIDAYKETAQAVVRAFCDKQDIDIHFTSAIPRSVGSAIYLREPKLPMTKEQGIRWRAETDRAVLKLVFYDPKIIAQYAPDNPKASSFYHGLCRLYADLCGIKKYAGIALNLCCLFQDDILDLGPDLENALPEELWVYFIAYSFAPKIFDEKTQKILAEFIKAVPAQFDFYLLSLKDHSDNLQDFAKTAHDMACFFFDQNYDTESLVSSQQSSEKPTFQPTEDSNLFGDSESLQLEDDLTINENGLVEDDQPYDDVQQKQSMRHAQDMNDDNLLEMDADFEFPEDAFESFSSEDFRAHKLDYKIYSKAFDQTVFSHDICSHDERQILRKELDFACKKYNTMTSKLAAKLQAKL